MELSNEKIRQLVTERPHQREIEKGIKHQQRLRFHTQTTLNKSDFEAGYWDFRHWIANESPELLPADKSARIMQLIRPPISTIELTESIFSKLRKIFHGQDSFFDYQFSNPDLKSDWSEYRDRDFWPTHGFDAMQSAIDSVWVVDFPDVQSGSRPEPFNRLIDISNVIDIENDGDNNCQYFIYRIGGFLVAYDSVSIRVFEYDTGVGAMTKEIRHGLGYTPARMFWTEKLDTNNLINKESPITKELSELDWLLFHKSAKRYMDLSNAYPREITYSADDSYQDDDRTENKDRMPGGKRPIGNKLMGPGTIIEVDPPLDSNEADLMKNPFLLISPDVETLKWHVTEETRLKNDIYRSVVGVDRDIQNDQAMNEKQVDSSFESQLSVLLRVKKNFEIIMEFSDSTNALLRYGNSFKGCTIDLGTGFFLKTVTELHEDYKIAKETGNEVVLEKITSNIYDAKYREDSASRQRAEIIRDLDPLPEKTVKEAIEIYKNNGIDKINFIIKTNLLTFVRRFERENIPLVQFGENIEYSSKIDTIINRFKEYAREFNDEGEQRPELRAQSD